MIFTRIIYCAILVGVVSGLLMSLMQMVTLDPIIFAAEAYEINEPGGALTQSHDGHNHDHQHDHDSWAPADGFERSFYTLLSNISAGIGFAAILLALMSLIWLPKQRNISLQQGLLWGVAGFIVIYLAPAIGLPPEIPGIQASAVEDRQIWWVVTVICAAIGLGILAFCRLKLKATGILFLAFPYLIGAPTHQGPEFIHPDAAAVEALIELHQRFILLSGTVNLLFWITLGLACGYAFNRWFRATVVADEHPA